MRILSRSLGLESLLMRACLPFFEDLTFLQMGSCLYCLLESGKNQWKVNPSTVLSSTVQTSSKSLPSAFLPTDNLPSYANSALYSSGKRIQTLVSSRYITTWSMP